MLHLEIYFFHLGPKSVNRPPVKTTISGDGPPRVAVDGGSNVNIISFVLVRSLALAGIINDPASPNPTLAWSFSIRPSRRYITKFTSRDVLPCPGCLIVLGKDYTMGPRIPVRDFPSTSGAPPPPRRDGHVGARAVEFAPRPRSDFAGFSESAASCRLGSEQSAESTHGSAPRTPHSSIDSDWGEVPPELAANRADTKDQISAEVSGEDRAKIANDHHQHGLDDCTCPGKSQFHFDQDWNTEGVQLPPNGWEEIPSHKLFHSHPGRGSWKWD